MILSSAYIKIIVLKELFKHSDCLVHYPVSVAGFVLIGLMEKVVVVMISVIV